MPNPRKKKGKSKANPKQKTKKPLPPPPEPIVEIEPERLAEIENIRFIELIEIVRTTKNSRSENDAFIEIYEKLRPRIQKMTNRFSIPGLNNDDVMQEAMLALRSKAIKDYDQDRGSGEGLAMFDRFALLCIRRHLSTEFKSSLQNNRKKVLNQSISLNQEIRGSDDDLSLSNIVASKDGDIPDSLQNREYFRNLMSNLFKHLSKFEREVLFLYAQRLSYEEIADKINDRRVKIKVNVKGIDNALGRIKKKAKGIISEYDAINGTDDEIALGTDNALSRIKKKAKGIISEYDVTGRDMNGNSSRNKEVQKDIDRYDEDTF